MKPSDELLHRLHDLAKQLSDETDRVNAALDDFEEELEKSGIGVTAFVAGPEDWRIGYKKMEGKWRLVAERADAIVKLTSAPRLVRIAALDLQDQLIQALIDKATECLDAIRKGTAP